MWHRTNLLLSFNCYGTTENDTATPGSSSWRNPGIVTCCKKQPRIPYLTPGLGILDFPQGLEEMSPPFSLHGGQGQVGESNIPLKDRERNRQTFIITYAFQTKSIHGFLPFEFYIFLLYSKSIRWNFLVRQIKVIYTLIMDMIVCLLMICITFCNHSNSNLLYGC